MQIAESGLKYSSKLLFLIALIVLTLTNFPSPLTHAQGQNGNNNCNPLPPTGCLVISINGFFESNHTAVLSIFSVANVFARGGAQLGGATLNVIDEPENQYYVTHAYTSTGQYLDQNKTMARWTWTNASTFHGVGSNDFYPYDAWLFTITVFSPFLYGDGLNSTNTYLDLRNYLTGWNYNCPQGCFSYSYHSMVITFVLSRFPGGSLVPAAYVPWILWFLLGVTVLIPPDDLASKATIYTSIIFFLAGLLFARVLSFQSTGESYVENTLYYILFLTSIYVFEAIFERLLCLRKRSIKWSAIRITVELCITIITAETLSVQYTSFSSLVRSYWWVTFPVNQTLYIPAILVSWATVVNVSVIAYRMLKKPAVKPFEYRVNTGLP
jgi:hypothetical protein